MIDQPHIPFNHPTFIGTEAEQVAMTLNRQKIGPGGTFSKKCQDWLGDTFDTRIALPTGSCTAALEIAAMLLDLTPGDEVIMPSFGYPSTANAFVRVGAVPVFVDIEPVTMNIDPRAVEAAITPRTRAIVPIHYGGQPADMDALMEIGQRHDLVVVEDAANAFLAQHRGRHCGTIGALGCFSFHETKAVHCGQGGALLINDPAYIARAEVLLEKGTDRRNFLRGEIDRYTWKDIGSAYALDDIRAAFLLAQLQASTATTNARVALWQTYRQGFAGLADTGRIEIPQPVADCTPNGMIFWLKTRTTEERDDLIASLARDGVHCVFHYIPLHSADAGHRFGRFHGADTFTSEDSARLVRLPMFDGLQDINRIVTLITAFYTVAARRRCSRDGRHRP